MGKLVKMELTFSVERMVKDAEIIEADDLKAHFLMVQDTLEWELRGIINSAVSSDGEWSYNRKKIKQSIIDLTGEVVGNG